MLVVANMPRVTQIMNLLNFAPDIQEAILFLPEFEAGRERLSERDLKPIATEADWRRQKRMWGTMKRNR